MDPCSCECCACLSGRCPLIRLECWDCLEVGPRGCAARRPVSFVPAAGCACWRDAWPLPKFRALSPESVRRLFAALCSGAPEWALAAALEFRDAVTSSEVLLRDARAALRKVYRIDCSCGNMAMSGTPMELAAEILRKTPDKLPAVCDILVDAGARMDALGARHLRRLLACGSSAAWSIVLKTRIATVGISGLLGAIDHGLSPSAFHGRGVVRHVLAWRDDSRVLPKHVAAEAAAATISPGLLVEVMRSADRWCDGYPGLPPEHLLRHENLRLVPFRTLVHALWPGWAGGAEVLAWFDGLRAAWVGATVRAGLQCQN